MSDANQGRAGRKTINRSPTSPFAANLKKVFWSSGQSQAEAAEGLGVSRQTFNNWINGQNQRNRFSRHLHRRLRQAHGLIRQEH